MTTNLNDKTAKKNINCELSLDELKNVSGGCGISESGGYTTVTLTREEYEKLQRLLKEPAAAEFLKPYGLTADDLAMTITRPTEQIKDVLPWLKLLPLL